jgi:hypothetical protein
MHKVVDTIIPGVDLVQNRKGRIQIRCTEEGKIAAALSGLDMDKYKREYLTTLRRNYAHPFRHASGRISISTSDCFYYGSGFGGPYDMTPFPAYSVAVSSYLFYMLHRGFDLPTDYSVWVKSKMDKLMKERGACTPFSEHRTLDLIKAFFDVDVSVLFYNNGIPFCHLKSLDIDNHTSPTFMPHVEYMSTWLYICRYLRRYKISNHRYKLPFGPDYFISSSGFTSLVQRRDHGGYSVLLEMPCSLSGKHNRLVASCMLTFQPLLSYDGVLFL